MPTPWASKDYCDYSKHVHCLYGSAVCFSSTPQQRRLFRRANGTASSHHQLAAVSRPVSGLAARSGLAGTRQSRAVQSCGGAEQGNTQGSRADSRPQATSNHLSLHVPLLRPSSVSLSLPSLLFHTHPMNPSTHHPPPPLLHHTHMCL